MAYYAALASLVQLLENIILHDRYPTFLIGKQPFIKSLHTKFRFLEESLQEYSSSGDEAADHLEGRIRDLAYRVQDVIETEISRQIQIDSRETNHSRVITACKCSFCHIDLAKVKQEVDSIVEDMTAMKGSHGNESLQPKDYCTDIGASKQSMVGFDEYLTTIKDQLCGESSQLKIVSIVGMGGIGKTTLARNTFDDSLISYHFYCRAWTTISQNYSAKRVFQSVLKSLSSEANDLFGEEEEMLKEKIYKSLKGRRYLIVLDDVWSTNFWDDMKRIFPNDSNGSRILLTTRLSDVAQYIGDSGFVHEMRFLNVDASWNLLREKVFAQESCPLELEETGKFIASKCRGLPLAIVVIAGILSDARTTQHWEKVAGNVGSILSRDGEHLSEILSLSFIQLSHQLKACFLYMGSFPEDYEIKISRLTWLWIAEGFLLDSVGESKTLEEVAEDCLKELVERNLVLITKKRANGKFKYCSMHDLLRDFCRQRALHEHFFHDIDWKNQFNITEIVRTFHDSVFNGRDWERHQCTDGAESIRRIILHPDLQCEPLALPFHPFKSIRSILCLGQMRFDVGNILSCGNFELVKVLDFFDAPHRFAPLKLSSRMFHLKYLAFRFDKLSKRYFPSSIFKLQNLQTLIIDCSGMYGRHTTFPSEFWQMSQLRHLVINSMELPPLPIVGGIHVQKLEYLQTLETVKNFIFTIEAIEMVPNLRKLKIRCIDIVDNEWKKYGLMNLVHMHQLEELKINFTAFMFSSVESSCSSFVFPQNLKKLSLGGCKLPWKDLSVAGSLPYLQVLRLRYKAMVGEEWEPVEGEFLQLKFLLLDNIDLQCWRADSAHFPRLEHLKIKECRKLQEIPSEIGDIPTLKFITVHNSKLAGDSAELILEEQQGLGNDVLQVVVHRWRGDLGA